MADHNKQRKQTRPPATSLFDVVVAEVGPEIESNFTSNSRGRLLWRSLGTGLKARPEIPAEVDYKLFP